MIAKSEVHPGTSAKENTFNKITKVASNSENNETAKPKKEEYSKGL